MLPYLSDATNCWTEETCVTDDESWACQVDDRTGIAYTRPACFTSDALLITYQEIDKLGLGPK